jgi:hypothetical protein
MAQARRDVQVVLQSLLDAQFVCIVCTVHVGYAHFGVLVASVLIMTGCIDGMQPTQQQHQALFNTVAVPTHCARCH